jgi:hypothetical protein
MRDYFEIGPTPSGEDCAQVGEADFHSRGSREMDAYIGQLNRQFGSLIEGTSVSFKKKWFDHDFGRYGEVVIAFDDSDENSHIVYQIERELPEYWDDEAIAQLEKGDE